MATGPIYAHLRSRLEASFAPSTLIIENESHRHSSGKGAESHFKVLVVSDAFAHQSLLERHRAVNTAVQMDGQLPVHALSIKAVTEAQFAAGADELMAAFTTPPCLGGEKKKAAGIQAIH